MKSADLLQFLSEFYREKSALRQRHVAAAHRQDFSALSQQRLFEGRVIHAGVLQAAALHGAAAYRLCKTSS